ncbi:unnamed protein product [Amoebophrya sp. A25]|nr:unnamed protein product [Amoebophrya sp. A25]|eukprot:GSA25T00013593001.1
MTSRTSAAAGEYLHGVADYLERVQLYPFFHGLVKELASRQPEDPVAFLVDFISKQPSASATARNRNSECSASVPRILVIGEGSERLAQKLVADESIFGRGVTPAVYDGKKEFSDGSGSLVKMRQTENWVCYDYPRSAAEALAVEEARVLISLVVILQDRSEREATAADHALAGVVAQLPENLMCFVDHDEALDETNLAIIAKRLKQKRLESAPTAAPQIIIHGPRGSGCTTQAELLAKKRGLVLVDAHRLCAGSKTSEERKKLVEARLARRDAKQQGFVLCHYPAAAEEAMSLKKYLKGLYPGEPKLIHLQANGWSCGRRLAAQMYRDAGSGRIAAPLEAGPRASISGPDCDHAAHEAYITYRQHISAMAYQFSDWTDIDAGQSIQHVSEEIAEALD